jgi:hypothetical protein
VNSLESALAVAAMHGISIRVVDTMPLPDPAVTMELAVKAAREWNPQKLVDLTREKEWWRNKRPR